MALSPIGNITYINQNAQLGSIVHANNTAKPEFALNANMQEFVDKLKSVQEVSPTPQNEAIDPNNEEQKKRDNEQDETKEIKDNIEARKQEADQVAPKSHHILDVRA